MKGGVGRDNDGFVFQERFIVVGIIKDSNASTTFVDGGGMESDNFHFCFFFFFVLLYPFN